MAENRRFEHALLVFVVILVIVVDAVYERVAFTTMNRRTVAILVVMHLAVVIVVTAAHTMPIAMRTTRMMQVMAARHFTTEQRFGVLVETANRIGHSVADAEKSERKILNCLSDCADLVIK